MGAYKRKLSKGERWFFSGQYLNQKYFSKAIYLTKKEATTAEREELKRLDEQARRPKSAMMLHELMTKRLDYLEAHKSKMYYNDARRYFKNALDAWGNIEASAVTKLMVHDLLLEEGKRLKKKGKTSHAPNAMLRAIKALFNWGNKIYDLDLKNPCNLDFLKVDKKLKHIPSDEEVEAIRDSLIGKQRLLFDFADQTACRIMEAVRFTYEDIRGKNIVLFTRKARNSDLTPRVIPIPECIQGVEWKGLLFPEWTHHPRFLEDVIRKKGYKWSWHNLRHRRASTWANSGMSTFEIQHRLGHTNVKTTMIYLQFLGFNG